MPQLKLSPLFKNLFNFRGYKLGDLYEDEDGVTLVLNRARATADCPICGRRCSSSRRHTRAASEISTWERSSAISSSLNGRSDAAAVVEIDWKAAKRIEKKYLSRLVTGLEGLTPQKLGIDEIAYETGHRFSFPPRD